MPRKPGAATPELVLTAVTSMRPRPDAAENPLLAMSCPTTAPDFNEAAARCRGKPLVLTVYRNRAAATSMRPRPDAAENRTEELKAATAHAALQ